MVPRDRQLNAENKPDDEGSCPDVLGKTQNYMKAIFINFISRIGMVA